MNMLFLETPTIDRKTEALDYLKEHVEYKSELNGTGSMNRCLDKMSYEEWLIELEKRKNIEYLNKINRCPSKTYFVVRYDDNKIVGMINIRYNISNDKLQNGASHIGYGIRPTERKKSYAKIALFLGLIEEQKLGEENVLLDCKVDNIASNKTILALGGKLKKADIDSSDNIMKNYYWINVKESINKYSKLYNRCIISNKNI